MKYTGKKLIEMGYKPNKWFGDALDYLNSNNLSTKEVINYLNNLVDENTFNIIEPFKEPVIYDKYIKSTNNIELNNINSVIENMDSVMKTPTVVGGAIMPDACPTGPGNIPVGGVVITKNAIHPAMHSSDMCCSVFATNLGNIDPKKVLDVAFNTTQFGPGKRKGYNGWSSVLSNNKYLYNKIINNYFTKDYIEKALTHLGTQGDGNHFLYVGKSENTGDIWLVTHHGSRGFGASVYKKGMATAEKFRKKISPNTDSKNAWIPYTEKEGALYWDAIQIIREWTKLNHTVIHDRIINKIKIPYLDRFWNEHNSVFKDGDLFYHAKGATPLADKFVPDSSNGRRLIPLNMSQPILVVRNDDSYDFAPHGAGRNMSRTQHKNILNNKSDIKIFNEETKDLDVRFYSGKIDISELPSAYKNADEVIKQINDFNLGKIIDKINPYGCIMAGDYSHNKPWLNKNK